MKTLRVPPTLTTASVRDLLAALPDGPVALIGADGTFCRGMDLEEGPGALDGFAALLEAVSRRVAVAVVDGEALGGGVGLAAACDLVVATPRATFALPEVLAGVVPAIVTPWIARRVGPTTALAMSLGLLALDAEAALRRGLADLRVDDPEPLLAGIERRLGCADRHAVTAVKRLFAAHYPPRSDWWRDAAPAFEALAGSPTTRARLEALAAGDAPWLAEAT